MILLSLLKSLLMEQFLFYSWIDLVMYIIHVLYTLRMCFVKDIRIISAIFGCQTDKNTCVSVLFITFFVSFSGQSGSSVSIM